MRVNGIPYVFLLILTSGASPEYQQVFRLGSPTSSGLKCLLEFCLRSDQYQVYAMSARPDPLLPSIEGAGMSFTDSGLASGIPIIQGEATSSSGSSFSRPRCRNHGQLRPRGFASWDITFLGNSVPGGEPPVSLPL